MGMVAFRIPDDMKKQMEQVDVNWSDYIRNAISEALHSERKRLLLEKIHKLASHRGKVKSGTSVKILRRMRDNG